MLGDVEQCTPIVVLIIIASNKQDTLQLLWKLANSQQRSLPKVIEDSPGILMMPASLISLWPIGHRDMSQAGMSMGRTEEKENRVSSKSQATDIRDIEELYIS